MLTDPFSGTVIELRITAPAQDTLYVPAGKITVKPETISTKKE